MKPFIVLLFIVLAVSMMTYITFISSFNLLGETMERVIFSECNFDNTYKVVLTKYDGNAVTNPSISVLITRCNENNFPNEVVFNASKSNITNDLIELLWIGNGSLLIKYDNGINVFNRHSICKARFGKPVHILYEMK